MKYLIAGCVPENHPTLLVPHSSQLGGPPMSASRSNRKYLIAGCVPESQPTLLVPHSSQLGGPPMSASLSNMKYLIAGCVPESQPTLLVPHSSQLGGPPMSASRSPASPWNRYHRSWNQTMRLQIHILQRGASLICIAVR
jgi:hypothetical protein